MNSPAKTHKLPAVYLEADLLKLEIRVARRADQLSLKHGGSRGRDLEHWLQAEREILRTVFARRAAPCPSC
jgi:hypothetical protein